MKGDVTRWLKPGRLFDGLTLAEGRAVAVENGRVTRIVDAVGLPEDCTVVELDGILSPGFVDLQVNGGGGVLFNETPTVDGIRRIAQAHRQLGTVAFLPTVITDAPQVLARAVEAALEAHETVPGVLGIHIEGPHISMARRGTHAARHVRPMEPRTLAHVERLRRAGLAVMVTLAPEAADADQIAALAATGATVSIGHTDADADTARTALAAGARCFTHLFNAMSPMLNRAPGTVGAAINSSAFCGIICDGIHVADEMVGLAIRARPVPDRMFLVSDAMPTVGGPDHFDLYGERVSLIDGQLLNREGTLAGAHTTIHASVKRLVKTVGVGLETALRMATSVPRAALAGAEPAALVPGTRIDELIVLSDDLTSVAGLQATVG